MIARKIPRRPIAEHIKDYALNSQNPGHGRNFTSRDSHLYVDPMTTQMSGMFRLSIDNNNQKRTYGYGVYGE